MSALWCQFREMTWPTLITLAIAILGAGLGIFNTWQGLRDRAVRLRVIPKYAEPVDDQMRKVGPPCISIEVQNLGSYPVTVEEVGLLIENAASDLPRRAAFLPQYVMMGPKLPHRLDRQDSITVAVPINSLPDEDFTGAFARTAAGQMVKGTSAALTDIAEIITSSRQRRQHTWEMD